MTGAAQRQEGPLADFVRESNRIEGIRRDPTLVELQAHDDFLAERDLSVEILESFVSEVADAQLREWSGMDVRVGGHLPPRGGPDIKRRLGLILLAVNVGDYTPYGAHIEYESLHPFMDGNGRSGRAIWAWQMRQDGHDPFALPFLHRFYYQALDASPRRLPVE